MGRAECFFVTPLGYYTCMWAACEGPSVKGCRQCSAPSRGGGGTGWCPLQDVKVT